MRAIEIDNHKCDYQHRIADAKSPHKQKWRHIAVSPLFVWKFHKDKSLCQSRQCQVYVFQIKQSENKTGPVEFSQPALTTRCFPRASILGKKFREHLIVRFTGAPSRSRTGTPKLTRLECCRYTIRAPAAMCTARSPVVQ